MNDDQRASRIRHLNARMRAIEEERRKIVAELLPLETAESWSMGYRCVMRGKPLLDAMWARDKAAQAKKAGAA